MIVARSLPDSACCDDDERAAGISTVSSVWRAGAQRSVAVSFPPREVVTTSLTDFLTLATTSTAA